VEELPDRNEILGRVLRHFERCYEIFCADSGLSGLLREYQQLLANKDQPVRVLDQNAPYEGICLGINAAGELLVKTEDGTVRTVNSGEVSVRGLYSYV
ncbi:MAG: biotin--[Blautia sp.]|nr:biotin--[acetyl-CoA-carboxylase] ligase [Blautia sp.]